MPTTTAGRRGPKPSLSREAVVEAALDLIDAEGLPALNLRKLATRLGISAMTPYNYFADKADLLGAMVVHALTPLAGDLDPTKPWDTQLDNAMRDLHRALQRHPGVVELILAESDSVRLDDFRQGLIATLESVGLPKNRSTDILRSFTSYIVGYAVLNRLRPQSARKRSADSFDCGLDMLMSALRTEVGERATTGRSR